MARPPPDISSASSYWPIRHAVEDLASALAQNPPAGVSEGAVRRFFRRYSGELVVRLTSLVRSQLRQQPAASGGTAPEIPRPKVDVARRWIEPTLNGQLEERQAPIEIAVKLEDGTVKNFTATFEDDGTHLIGDSGDRLIAPNDGKANMDDVLRGIEAIDPHAIPVRIIGVTNRTETVVLPGSNLRGLKGWEHEFG